MNPHSGNPLAMPVNHHDKTSFLYTYKNDKLDYILSNRWMIGCEVYDEMINVNRFVLNASGKSIDVTSPLSPAGYYVQFTDISSFLFVTDDGKLTRSEFIDKFFGGV